MGREKGKKKRDEINEIFNKSKKTVSDPRGQVSSTVCRLIVGARERCRVLLLIFLLSPSYRRRQHEFILYYIFSASNRRSFVELTNNFSAQQESHHISSTYITNKNRIIAAWETFFWRMKQKNPPTIAPKHSSTRSLITLNGLSSFPILKKYLCAELSELLTIAAIDVPSPMENCKKTHN